MTENMDEMRPRNASIEMNLAEPYKYSRDLSGTYIDETRSKINHDIEIFRKGGKPVEKLVENDSPYQLEYGLKVSCIYGISGKDDYLDWTSTSSADYLADAKQRKLRSANVFDYTFKLRSHSKKVFHGITYLNKVISETKNYKYVESAATLNSIVTPIRFGKTKNSFHKYYEQIDIAPGSTFSTALRLTERQQLHNDIKLIQNKLNQIFSLKNGILFLKDYSSLDDANAASTHILCFNTIRALSYNSSRIDIYQPTNKYANKSISFFNPNARHHARQIHNLLFIPEREVDLIEKKQLPDTVNDGSGLPTLKNLLRWNDSKLLLSAEDCLTEETNELITIKSNYNIEDALNHILWNAYQTLFESKSFVNEELREEALQKLVTLTSIIGETKFNGFRYTTVNFEYKTSQPSNVSFDTIRKTTQTIDKVIKEPQFFYDTKKNDSRNNVWLWSTLNCRASKKSPTKQWDEIH